MLLVQNLGVHFAGNYLFDNVSFRINKGNRVGLAGKNGAGKSTLLKILAKKQQADEGDIVYEGEVSVEIGRASCRERVKSWGGEVEVAEKGQDRAERAR